MRERDVDIVVVGAGAAGLMAAIWAGREAWARGQSLSILALDGAKTLGAKILVAGGGRCNVTHHAVDEGAYAGSSRNAIKKVLRSFTVEETVEFFRELGVELKREETGKLFPTTDSARTVLNALLRAAEDAGVEIVHPWRVGALTLVPAPGAEAAQESRVFHVERAAQPSEPDSSSPEAPHVFHVEQDGTFTSVRAKRVILATGGRALPRSGSDGAGYEFAKGFGHTLTSRVFPALVPLVVQDGHFIRTLSGIATPATLEVRAATGKRLASFTNSTLCTHFGLSGPGPLDVSRYLTEAKHTDPGAMLVINWLPEIPAVEVDQQLQQLGKATPIRWLRGHLPERLAEAICVEAGIDPGVPGHGLTREARRLLVGSLTEMRIPVVGDRGYTYAEVTAGGVPLSEVRLETMESRVCPGLHLCGEICDVDGRIGGFNFQWAWASGYLAGVGAARGIGVTDG